MRIILGECVDRRLARELPGHEVSTVPRMGWAGTKNGELLRRAQSQFDAFVTVDQNLGHQLPVNRYSIAIVILRTRSNSWPDVHPLVPALLRALPQARSGVVTWVGE